MSDGWQVLKQTELLNALPWLRVLMEEIRLEDGETVIDDFYTVEIAPFSIVFALTEQGTVPMIRQYRHAVGQPTLELPAGGFTKGEETPLEAAQRELLEETGLVTDDWLSLGSYVGDPNKGCGTGHLYLARHAVQERMPDDSAELQRQQVLYYSLGEIRKLWLSGEIASIPTIALIGLALAHLNKLAT